MRQSLSKACIYEQVKKKHFIFETYLTKIKSFELQMSKGIQEWTE